ncbi:MAG TPA: hypothetical protein VNW72_00250 [Chthoniobacterales bacterium]|nr:hypothetical protein [Chthoniobacterales bacterium]
MRRSAIAIFLACAARAVFAQGGPPMITDDPGTPGNGKWENNLAISFEHRSNETSYNLPEIDLNYGVGEHIQLTLQTEPVLLKREDHGPIGGLGGTEAAVKWRFLDEEKSGFDMSMFPRIIFNIQSSSARRGLAEDGTRFQIPFQAAKTFGRWHIDGEFGPLASTVGRSELLYGAVAGYDLAKPTMLMAELHGTSRINFTRDVLTVNFGLRHAFDEHRILIVSLGHEIVSPEDQLALIGYFGVQLVY